MAFLRISILRKGPGHSSCKAISVPTQDGPSRLFSFRLKPIRRDFWNVLCLGNAKTLIKAANEIIMSSKSSTSRGYDFLPATDVSSAKELDNSAKVPLRKTKGFWIVFSKRFKASLQILSAPDIVAILRAFDVAQKDTGVYVAAICHLRDKILEFDKSSLLEALSIFSRRLRPNTQKEFFAALANHVPNVLYEMSAIDIVATLWHLGNSGYNDPRICKRVHKKFLNLLSQLNEADMANASMAFGRFGYREESLYDAIESRISKDCEGSILFRLAWGFHLAGINVARVVSHRDKVLNLHLEKSSSNELKIWRDILSGTPLESRVEIFMSDRDHQR